MKKYLTRFAAALAAFSISLAIIYFAAGETLKTFVYEMTSSSVSTPHSAENNSPYALLDGTTVTIKPSGAQFEIPESWVNYKPYSIEPPKNLYLSYQDLNELDFFDFSHPYGFDKKDAQIMRAVLPFENCAAHIGSMSWGNGNTNDLQVRVSVTNLSVQKISDKINNQGLSKARRIFDTADLTSETYGSWSKQRMKVLETGSHTLLFKTIDFYYRPLGNETILFVFVHQSKDKAIKELLDSFRN